MASDEQRRPTINPRLWGTSMWETMHWIAAGYPDDPSGTEQVSFKKWFEMIGEVMPCGICRENYKKLLKDRSLLNNALANGGLGLRKWLVNIHTEVNKHSVGEDEPYDVWTLERADRIYPPASSRDWVREEGHGSRLTEEAEYIRALEIETRKQQAGPVEPPPPAPEVKSAKVAVARRTPTIRSLQRQSATFGMPNVSPAMSREAMARRLYNHRVMQRQVQISRETGTPLPKPKKKGCGCGGR